MDTILKFFAIFAASLAAIFAASVRADSAAAPVSQEPSQAAAQEPTAVSAPAPLSPISLQTSSKMRSETRYLVYCMEHGHYLKTSLSDLDVREFIREYMDNIDVFKLFFTTEDVQYFQDFFSPSIEIMLRQGTLLPAFSIYERFIERAKARLEWIKARMEKPFDLNTENTFRPDRKKENWPADIAAADKLWEARLEYDIINQLLVQSEEEKNAAEAAAGKKDAEKKNAPPSESCNDNIPDPSKESADKAEPVPTAAEVAQVKAEEKKAPKTFEEKLAEAEKEVLKRYTRLIENYVKADAMEIQEIFLNTLARLYDPHSAFLSEYYLEEFDISVRNALVGIGALLADKEGYCVLEELMAGGPAEDCKQLSPGDKILGVGQETGEIVDVVGMKLRKTVRMIRGKEGSKVRLLIQPAANPSARKVVTLVRREIKLTTKLAKAELYTIPVGDKTVPIGVIDLPTFYGEGPGEDGAAKGFSTSKDVDELLQKLGKLGVKGIVLDLRRNGGGFLNEAVDLAGLFIKTGPVVQVRSANGKVNKLADENPKIVWDGPLIIMVSRLSASATEIVAGALQNHQRAIVVGDKSTHGKGTVQAVLHLGNFDPQQKSAAKITVQKWYAPSGESIQLKGVHSDIVLPSVFDYMEIGEQYKDYAMKWDSILPDEITQVWGYGFPKGQADALMAKLTEMSEARQKSLEEFKLWNKRIDWVKDRQNKKDWSLNYAKREAELKSDEAFNDSVEKEEKELAKSDYKKTEVLLDSAKENGDSKSSKLSRKDSKKKKGDRLEDSESELDEEDTPVYDVQLREALRIMGDWIEILAKPETIKAPIPPREAPVPNPAPMEPAKKVVSDAA